MSKKMKVKYAICLPLMTLFLILGILGSNDIIPNYWAVAAIIVNGLCIVVLQSEMTFFAPRKKE